MAGPRPCRHRPGPRATTRDRGRVRSWPGRVRDGRSGRHPSAGGGRRPAGPGDLDPTWPCRPRVQAWRPTGGCPTTPPTGSRRRARPGPRYQRPLTRLRLSGRLSAVILGLRLRRGRAPPARRLACPTGWSQLIVMVVALELVLARSTTRRSTRGSTCVHDKEWDLSTQTGKGFVADQAKSFVLGLVVNVVLLVPLYWVIRSTDLWWLCGWLIVRRVQRRARLPVPGRDRADLQQVHAARGRGHADPPHRRGPQVDATSAAAYVADESKRSRRDNAYVAGLGATPAGSCCSTRSSSTRPRWSSRSSPTRSATGASPPAPPDPAGRRPRLRRVRRPAACWPSGTGCSSRPASDRHRRPRRGLPDPACFGVQAGFLVTGPRHRLGRRGPSSARPTSRPSSSCRQPPARCSTCSGRLHVKNLADLDPGLVKRLQATHPPAAERMALTSTWATIHGTSVRTSTARAGAPPVRPPFIRPSPSVRIHAKRPPYVSPRERADSARLRRSRESMLRNSRLRWLRRPAGLAVAAGGSLW